VHIQKYMPLILRVITPIRRPSTKLNKPAIRITTGRDSVWSIAEVYTPTPKNAAVASEM